MGTAEDDALEREFSLLEIAPADRLEHARWLQQVDEWRQRARQRYGANGNRPAVPGARWSATAYGCAMVMLWDEQFFDQRTGEFLVESYLERLDRQCGGVDVVVLWHAYPRIGFDDRNQFDFYRDLPGGLPALSGIVERLHRRGVKALLDYLPWDLETRRDPLSDGEVLAGLVVESGADGVYLDTLAEVPASFRAAIERARPGAVFQSERVAPLAAIRDHQLSWVEWPNRLSSRLLLRNRWFEQSHLQHLVRRWHADHRDELLVGWLNGAGVVVWENVFGSWCPWNEPDKALLRSIRRVQRCFAGHFSSGSWTPYVPMPEPDLQASRWEQDGVILWTLANRSVQPLVQQGAPGEVPEGSVLFEALSGRPIKSTRTGLEVPARGVAAIVAITPEALVSPAAVISACAGQASGGDDAELVTPERRSRSRRLRPRPSTRSSASAAMTELAPGTRTFEAVFASRECGTYRRAPFRNVAYPTLDEDLSFRRRVTIARLAVDLSPVSNVDYRRFLAETSYRPLHDHRFLEHWSSGSALPGEEQAPVVYVDLDDARSYARWAAKRLPTEEEWQVAMTETAAGRGKPCVWEWTESVRHDGHNRFAVLKGGADFRLSGSDWYAESGPLRPERSSKFLLFAPGIDRCGTVGFRCVIDLGP